MPKKINYRIIALFAFVIVSCGLAWPVNKIGLLYMSPLWFTSLRLIIATITMMLLVIAMKKFSLPKLKDYPLILIIGLLQIGLYLMFANIGLAYLPAGRSAVLAYTTPLWIMPAAVWFFNEEAGVLRWLGFFLGISGLTILLSPWELDWTSFHILFGAAMLLLASLGWAISMLCARYMHWTKSPIELIPWQLLIGTLPLLILAWISEPIGIVEWNTSLILALLYTGVLVTGLGYWCALIINKELPTLNVALGFLLVPIFSLLVSAAFMQEVINLPTMTAIVLIISGICCIVV